MWPNKTNTNIKIGFSCKLDYIRLLMQTADFSKNYPKIIYSTLCELQTHLQILKDKFTRVLENIKNMLNCFSESQNVEVHS